MGPEGFPKYVFMIYIYRLFAHTKNTFKTKVHCTQNFEVEGMGEGEGPEEENLVEEASVKSTVSISR